MYFATCFPYTGIYDVFAASSIRIILRSFVASAQKTRIFAVVFGHGSERVLLVAVFLDFHQLQFEKQNTGICGIVAMQM